VDFADDGVPADADLGGDLAAGQPGDDTMAELLDALRGPRRIRGSNTHDKAPFSDGRFWAACRAKAALARSASQPDVRRAVSAKDSGQAPSFTEPHCA
jgi:hypothetical protein